MSAAILAAGTFVIYRHTFSVPLLLDDRLAITDNPSIHHLRSAWSPPAGAGVGGRPLLNFSYALNYAWGGTALAGYHGLNLLVHVLASWTLFGVVRRTLLSPRLAERFGPAALPLALAVSAIWAWHPVQTEAVTYLSQRAESLMGLFYLLTIYCFIRGVERVVPNALVRPATSTSALGTTRSTSIWLSLSVLACLCGAATKEVIVSAPIIVFLYDRTFISGSFAAAWRNHRRLLLALAATWMPLGCLMGGLARRGVGFGAGVSGWAYGMTECRVVVKYLQLAVWPHPLVFDYGMFVAPRLTQVWPFAAVLVLLLGATGWGLFGRPAERGGLRLRPVGFGGRAVGFAEGSGFAGAWFFLILAPTSSIVPIAGQPMAESRLYLPLAGVAAIAVCASFAWIGRRGLVVFALAAAGLGAASVARNRAYRSEEAIWSDTLAWRPANPRAHNNLGNLWYRTPGRLSDAIAQYEEAVRLDPNYAEAHNNLGNAWFKLPGRLPDAARQFEAALRLDPDNAEAHNNLGSACLAEPGRRDEAVAQFQAALRLKPDYAEAHRNLGSAWSRQPGRLDDAIAQYEAALRLQPDDAEAHYDLGNAWSKMPGRSNEAISEYEAALRLRPDYAEARNNLGGAWSKTPGRLNDAIAEFQAALRLQPDNAEAHYNLGNAWSKMAGHSQDAIAELAAALRLKPDYAEAHNNLGTLWFGQPGRLNEALAQFQAAVRLEPENAEAQFNLAVVLLKLSGHNDEARLHLEACLRLRPDYEPARRLLAALPASSHE